MKVGTEIREQQSSTPVKTTWVTPVKMTAPHPGQNDRHKEDKKYNYQEVRKETERREIPHAESVVQNIRFFTTQGSGRRVGIQQRDRDKYDRFIRGSLLFKFSRGSFLKFPRSSHLPHQHHHLMSIRTFERDLQNHELSA